MEDKELELKTDVQKSTYSIITVLGSTLPLRYTGFVYSKWLRSLRYGNEYFKLINSDDYYSNYGRFIESVLNRENVYLRLAVLTDERDTALGFSVNEREILHYVYVKEDMRGLKIASSLVQKLETFTHLTKEALPIWNKKFPAAIFNPFK